MSSKVEHKEPVGRRHYKQMAISPEAHERITALADKKGISIIDTVDKLTGVK